MMHDSAIVSSTSNLDEKFESVSASVILELKKDDVVWIKLRVGQVYGHSPSHYTNFMGYRICDLTKSRQSRDAVKALTGAEKMKKFAKVQAQAALTDKQQSNVPLLE
jgi:hypothetical protein